MTMKSTGSRKKLEVAKHLTDEEYVQLLETYAAHNRQMWPEQRDRYGAHNIVKVERGEDGELHVHYKCGDWWHYTPERTWY